MSQTLITQLKIKNRLNYVVSDDEDTVIEFLHDECSGHYDSITFWSITSGIHQLGETFRAQVSYSPADAFDVIDQETRQLLVLLDFYPYLNEPAIQRRLKDLTPRLDNSDSFVVFISTFPDLPGNLKQYVTRVDFKLPDVTEIQRIYESIEEEFSLQTVSLDEKNHLICSGLGLTRSRLKKIYAQQFENPGILSCLSLIHSYKKQIIGDTAELEFQTPEENFDHVGGMHEIKKWLAPRGRYFLSPNSIQHLPAPKGIVVSGIPGVGKSLVAKAIAGEWRLPLVKVDGSQLFDTSDRTSDGVMQETIEKVERIAPAILWIDELDKPFTGIMGENHKGGHDYTFPTILNWLQDKRSSVFVVATANDISALPPALLRKGRFDELFYINLPNQQEREEIISIHSRGYLGEIESEKLDIELLVESSNDLTGAEIEQGIRTAHFEASMRNEDVRDTNILHAFKEIYPLARSLGDDLALMHQYATYRAKAVTPEIEELIAQTIEECST